MTLTEILSGTPNGQVRVSPDGAKYAAMGRGEAVPDPFRLRLLMPWICGDSARRWIVMRTICLIAIGPLSCLYLAQRGAPWAAGLAVYGLAGVTTIAWRLPVLVDLPAMVLTLAAVCLLAYSHPLAGVAAGLLLVAAAATKESTPIFAAAWAWHPLPLVALAVPAVLWWREPRAETNEPPLTHPWRTAWATHRPILADGATLFLPWGPLLVAVLALSWPLVVTVALAYAQLARSTDRTRLYQWAFPPVLATAAVVWPWSIPLFVLAAIFNPWKGDGL